MGTMKAIVGIVAIVAAVYLCATLIPPFFSNYQFEDAIKTEAQMSTYSTKSEEQIRDTIYKKAQELEIPMNREQIKVQRTGLQGSGSVSIDAPYLVHVDLPGYPLDLRFDPSTRNRSVF
ncbi:MAG: hypothetical protein DMG90_10595 [Acidobacteria bacterium]|jgi:hypothetical protein|nr:MAG: hypothetical protein DMG91_01390 [Acidobacteriota bacterium]PYV89730.1 MAG: hypothetical protein DMG90_10595 [Acidobacteriota bacterium]